jgi:lipopolysaccharide cholinephosphotransferase
MAVSPEDLKQCQRIQLALLKDFDRVCKERGWTYWLDGGTLLGAVRHKGFIPWDDDVDVVMPRKDFEAFRAEGQRNLDKSIFLQDYHTDQYDEFLFIKLRDRCSTMVEKKERGIQVPYHQGIFIDVFPIDTVRRGCHDKILRLFKISGWFSFLGKCVFVPKGARWKRRAAQIALFPAAIILNLIFRTHYTYLLFLHDRVFNRYIKKYVVNDENAVWFKPFMCNNFPRILFEKRDIFPVTTIEFEGSCFPAPANIHKYLELQYGDYMRLPPPEKQVIHSYAILPDTPCGHRESTIRE